MFAAHRGWAHPPRRRVYRIGRAKTVRRSPVFAHRSLWEVDMKAACSGTGAEDNERFGHMQGGLRKILFGVLGGGLA